MCPPMGICASFKPLPRLVIPLVEGWAPPTIRHPPIALTPCAWPTPFRSAPSVRSRPTDSHGRTSTATTEGIAARSIPAAADGTWFCNHSLRTRGAGFSLGRRGRSISDPDGRGRIPNAWLRGIGSKRGRRRRVKDVHNGDVARAQMVSLSGLDIAPNHSPLPLQLLSAREERQTILSSLVGHLLAV
jgi:hypothetical protein